MPTAYFLGAGASKADNFPLTRQLLWQIGAFIHPGRGKADGKELCDFLTTVFGVSPSDLETAARQWRSFAEARPNADPSNAMPPKSLPNLTDILSALDILISEEGNIGATKESRRALKGRVLVAARAQVVTAIARGFRSLHEERKPNAELLVERFVKALSSTDLLITTNWDILLDTACNKRFGTTESNYGTDLLVVGGDRSRDPAWRHGADPAPRKKGRAAKSSARPGRPKLLKLHGSLNWLYCPRCTHLRVEVEKVVAQLGHAAHRVLNSGRLCDCKVALEPLLVTPTFVKTYRNRHLLNIWSTAQRGLATFEKWVFVGYSLPDDDIHIKTLLLKAKQMRADTGEQVQVEVLTLREDAKELETRFTRLFGECQVTPGGFEALVRRVEASHAKREKRLRPQREARERKQRLHEERRKVRSKREKARRRVLQALKSRQFPTPPIGPPKPRRASGAPSPA